MHASGAMTPQNHPLDLLKTQKILPALDAFSDDFICTADDDIYYWPTWLEELTEGAALEKRTVRCHRAHRITFDHQGRYRPYSEWNADTAFRG
jgi:hypothetical protein